MGAELNAIGREKSIDALAAGASVTEAARRSGYSRKHVYRLLEDPKFAAEVARRKEALAVEVKAVVQTADERLALESLRSILQSGGSEDKDRVAAAKALLAHVTLGRKAAKPGPAAAPQTPVIKLLDAKTGDGSGDAAKAAADWLEKQA